MADKSGDSHLSIGGPNEANEKKNVRMQHINKLTGKVSGESKPNGAGGPDKSNRIGNNDGKNY